MWRIVEAEWGQKAAFMMLGMFPFILVVTWGIGLLTGNPFDAGMMGLVFPSLYPAMIVMPAVLWTASKERRARVWAGLPMSRTHVGLASAAVAVVPVWPLAVLNAAVGVVLSEQQSMDVLFPWSGLLLALIAATWTAEQVFGPKGMYAVGVGSLMFSILFDALAILLDRYLLGGDASFAEDKKPSTAVAAWMQDPDVGAGVYVAALLLLLIGLWRFRRRDLV